MLNGESDDCKKAVIDEIPVETGTRWSLQVFGNGSTLMEKQHGVIFALGIRIPGVKDTKEFLQELHVGLDVANDVDLIEEDQGVEDGESWVI